MHLVGLTGGIGSGKSTVAAAFAAHGWPVVDADVIAREVVAPGEPALAELATHFGHDVVRVDGTLDRAALARMAFTSDVERAALDAITHPHIAARVAVRLDALARDPAVRVAVLDHPLLIETGQIDRVDTVVVVLAPAESRVARLVTHRGLDEADARARLLAQTDDATRRKVATHVIANDGSLEDLDGEVTRTITAIERLAGDAERSEHARRPGTAADRP